MPSLPDHNVLGRRHLFLLVVLFLLLGLGTLLALANKTSIGASVAEHTVCVLGGWVVGDLALLDDDLVVDWECELGQLDLAIVGGLADLLGSLDLLLGSVAVLLRLELAWEENKTLLVLLQAGDVGGERLIGKVLAARVDGDTDGWRKLAWDTSLLFISSVSISHIS